MTHKGAARIIGIGTRKGECMEPELMTECADWIAEQMSEEGYLIDAELIELVLQKERLNPRCIPAISHQQAAAAVLELLAGDGIQGIPDSINDRLIVTILEWEDEFLSFAGRSR